MKESHFTLKCSCSKLSFSQNRYFHNPLMYWYKENTVRKAATSNNGVPAVAEYSIHTLSDAPPLLYSSSVRATICKDIPAIY